MPRTASDERPLKRQRSCINYYLSGGIDDSEQDGAPPMGSPMVEHSPHPRCAPSQTPAAALVPAPLPLDGLSPLDAPMDAPQVGNTVLHSLQRRFQTQQTLSDDEKEAGDALPDLPSIGKAPRDDDDFVLYSQPAYERGMSQRVSLGVTPLSQGTIDEEEEEDDGPAAGVEMVPLFVDPGDVEDSGLASQPPAPSTTDGAAPIDPSPAPGAAAGHTPAVHSVDRVQLNPAAVFPVYRSAKDCKMVYIVRHGESTYNADQGRIGGKWSDPVIFDAALTTRGRSQARSLRAQVASWKLPEDTLWVTSPLTRAIETMLWAFPGGHACADESAGPAGQCCAARLRNVAVLPEITEHLKTSGDIGRAPHDLAQRFPTLAPQMLGLPDSWWYNHHRKVNCTYAQKFEAVEPKDVMKKRVGAFRKWVMARPEKVIVAVGHSLFWKEFAAVCNGISSHGSMGNCEWMQLHV